MKKQSRPRKPRDVQVQWNEVPCTDEYRRQLARDVVALVIGFPQRRLDAPSILDIAPEHDRPRTSESLPFVADGGSITGFVDATADSVTFYDETGQQVKAKRPSVDSARSKLVNVSASRKKATINIRPGEGGLQRRLYKGADPLEGLERYGPMTVRAVGSGGARIAIIEVNPDGNTLALARNSSDEDDDTILGQVRPVMALADQHPDQLSVRFILCGIEMKGWWPVRFHGPPASPGEHIREDMAQIGRWINEGWLEHIVIRDLRRLAREAVEGGLIIREVMERQGIGLWAADANRRYELPQDRMLLSFYNVIAQENREHDVKKLQLARLNRGPLVGKGWGAAPFGFIRRRDGLREQDPAQWPFIRRLVDLADSRWATEKDVSFKAIVAVLAEEGCPMSVSLARKIIHNDIYVTGEWSVNVRGIPVAQTPIPLVNGLPAAQVHRVRELLALRQGKVTRTPLGTYVLNYVPTFHTQCLDENESGLELERCRLRASCPPGRKIPLYSHARGRSSRCTTGGDGPKGGRSWRVETLEGPIMAAVRELGTNPLILEQASLAVRHELPDGPTRLTSEMRVQLEKELAEQQERLGSLADEWVQRPPVSGQGDLDGFEAFTQATRRRIKQLRVRLDADTKLSQEAPSLTIAPDRARAFLEIMTVDPPEDLFLLQLRARIFQRIVSRVLVDDHGEGPITITLEGALVPDADDTRANPLLMAADLLDAYRNRTVASENAPVDVDGANVLTAHPFSKDSAVLTIDDVVMMESEILALPGYDERVATRQASVDENVWVLARSKPKGVRGWTWTVECDRWLDSPTATADRVSLIIRDAGRPMSRVELMRDWGFSCHEVELLDASPALKRMPPRPGERRNRVWFDLNDDDSLRRENPGEPSPGIE